MQGTGCYVGFLHLWGTILVAKEYTWLYKDFEVFGIALTRVPPGFHQSLKSQEALLSQ